MKPILLFLLISGVAHAEVYKVMGEDGRYHYESTLTGTAPYHVPRSQEVYLPRQWIKPYKSSNPGVDQSLTPDYRPIDDYNEKVPTLFPENDR